MLPVAIAVYHLVQQKAGVEAQMPKDISAVGNEHSIDNLRASICTAISFQSP
jgi:hypothetical protein